MNIAETAAQLQTIQQAMILIHQSPDGDCIGSGYALAALLRQMGCHAVVRCSDPIPERYAFLAVEETPDTVDEDAAVILSVDVADHIMHRSFAKACCLYPKAAAACEIVYAIAKELPVKLTPQIATCLYTGMATDTGCFQFDNVTPHTLRIVADLMEQFPEIHYAWINRAMFAL